jgi:transmembrane 9 superfamily protein 3
MFYDDIPIWSFIGKTEKENRNGKDHIFYYLSLHMHFDTVYNGNRVVDVMLSAVKSMPVEIPEEGDFTLHYSYSVKWTAAATPFEKWLTKFEFYAYGPEHLKIRIDFACPVIVGGMIGTNTKVRAPQAVRCS